MFKLLTTGDEFDVLGVYAKGKNLKGIRFLLENKKTKEQEIFFIDDSTTSHYSSPHPFGIDFGFVSEFKWVTKTHIKNKNYNYYYIDNDITKLEKELQRFRKYRTYWPVKGELGAFSTTFNPYFLFNGKYY